MTPEQDLLLNLVVLAAGLALGWHWQKISDAIWRAWRWLLRI